MKSNFSLLFAVVLKDDLSPELAHTVTVRILSWGLRTTHVSLCRWLWVCLGILDENLTDLQTILILVINLPSHNVSYFNFQTDVMTTSTTTSTKMTTKAPKQSTKASPQTTSVLLTKLSKATTQPQDSNDEGELSDPGNDATSPTRSPLGFVSN